MLPEDDLPFCVPVSPQPGLVVCRRGLLASIAAACAAANLPGASARWLGRVHPADGFGVEEFVAAVAPVCRELIADTSARGQDRYLVTLASFAVRLCSVPVPEMRQTGPGKHIGSNHGPDPFTMLHWRLEPGAVISPHAHTYGNVVTLGLTGSALVSNYEVVGTRDFDAKGAFEVQRTVEQVLRAGDINLVSLERHYVHGFVGGPEGASGLDITTRLHDRRAAPLLEIGEATKVEERRFRATWRQG